MQLSDILDMSEMSEMSDAKSASMKQCSRRTTSGRNHMRSISTQTSGPKRKADLTTDALSAVGSRLVDRSSAIEVAPIALLRPYASNARIHSRKQIRQIADSIQKFGFTNP